MNADDQTTPREGDASDVGLPDPPAAKFLVRVGTAGIGGAGVHISDPKKAMVPLSLTLGREAAGFVEKLGPRVKGPQGAQTVLVAGIWGCATCVACLSGRDSTCEYWARRPPVMLPRGLRFDDSEIWGMTSPSVRRNDAVRNWDRVKAAPVSDAGIMPCRAINLALPHLRAAATVALIGVGGVGPVVVQVLRASTAYRIIALDTDTAQLHGEHGARDGIVARARATQAVVQPTSGLGLRSKLDVAGMLANAIVAGYGALVAAGLGTGSFLIVANRSWRENSDE